MKIPVLLVSLFLTLSSTSLSNASLIINVNQQGNDVVATGSGSINLTGLTLQYTDNIQYPLAAYLQANDPGVILGSGTGDHYNYISNSPYNFGPGTGGTVFASAYSGNLFGFDYGQVVVPSGYISGSPLSGTATFGNKTFADIGITPDTYTWTLTNNDSVTLNINVSTVPEPSTYALLCISLGVVGYARKKMVKGEG